MVTLLIRVRRGYAYDVIDKVYNTNGVGNVKVMEDEEMRAVVIAGTTQLPASTVKREGIQRRRRNVR